MGSRGSASSQTNSNGGGKRLVVASNARVGDYVRLKSAEETGRYSYWEQMMAEKVGQYGWEFSPDSQANKYSDFAMGDKGARLAQEARKEGLVSNDRMKVVKATEKALQVQVIVEKRNRMGEHVAEAMWDMWMPKKAFWDGSKK